MAIISNPQTLDLEDIQGMVIRGYGKLFQTAYWLLRVDDAGKAKSWMKEIMPKVDSADISNKVEKTLHLAFTAKGLTALGMDSENVATFPVPFREGMVTDDRSRILGDYDESDPSNWGWGGHDDNLHLLLIFHARDKASMNSFLEEERSLLKENEGLTIIKEMYGFLREDNKEPFGFHDGISQPTVKGSGRSGPENDIVETGEFLMGYKNEHGQYPYSPLIEKDQGNTSLLSEDAAGSGKKDLGRNGSFMVFRQFEQHVDEFWNFMEDKTKNPDGSVNEEAKIKLAAKCIGRWPSGASLVVFPDKDPGGAPDNDDFGYADLDPDGFRCPFGSHLRRNNPRDTFRWYNPKQSLKVSRRHRIIRRGRNYELPHSAGNEEVNVKETGLHFICFNANLQLQFEFIQHAWANNNQLRHLTNDIDLVIGVGAKDDPNRSKGQFTIQAEPANQFIDLEDWKRFITVKGGQYFFFPSMTVLNYLTTI